jgi:hypothetical protein
MKMPTLLLGAGLLFWGWQTGLWLLAVPIALILEGARFVEWRWDLSEADFRRIFNLCIVLLVIFVVYLMRTDRSPSFIFGLMQWLPAIFFPLLTAQAYSTCDRLHIQALVARKAQKLEAIPHQSWMLNLNYPYVALCILAASAANGANLSFYGGMVGLLGLALWQARPRQSSAIAWACCIVIAGSTGFVGQFGLHQLHLVVEQQAVNWLSTFNGQAIDPSKKNTNIGDIGLLKRSSDIVFRVASHDKQKFPLLLREATYNKYQSATWIALDAQFKPLQPDSHGSTWKLGNPTTNPSTIAVAATLDQGKGFLRLPDGTFQVDQLPAAKLERNQYGTVKLTGSANPITYQIQFGQGRSLDSPPTEADLQIPPAEKPAIAAVLKQLSLAGKSPPAVLKQVDGFFQKNFSYTLNLVGTQPFISPLTAFLLTQRLGHCEYFATATTLLLRAAGIPARYATGYSVHEFSRLENQYIVRSRNAHAWTMAYVDGQWQALDTTPPSWMDLEDAGAAQWQLFADLWSLLSFKLAIGLRQIDRLPGFKYWWWLLLPTLFLLTRQFNRTKRVQRLAVQRTSPTTIAPAPPPGSDSEFYLIEQALTELGWARHSDESLKAWVERLSLALPASQTIDLRSIVALHYRYRFDPASIAASERAKLTSLCQAWLERDHTLYTTTNEASI